ncbi:MAG: twin-arginine translocation pathway signal protein [Alphaproteobacteria bacterium]|nr:twin-arginine translocation pathway signal protein [Alphaproteobacteria bacterium]
MRTTRRLFMAATLAIAGTFSAVSVDRAVAASTAQELSRDADDALQNLYRSNPVAKDISRHARAILVFPSIVKAGLVFGGAYGEGVLFEKGHGEEYYNSFTGSWGLQAGAQSYGYAVFLMTKKAVDYVHKTDGWEIGVGPTVVIVDAGAAKNLSTSTLKDDAYAFIFDQKGLMAGIALEGTKISHIDR